MKELYKFQFPSKILTPALFLLLTLSLLQSHSASAQKRTMTARPNVIIDAWVHGFWESLPASYTANPTKKYPLLIFLHGTGEIGAGTAASLPAVCRNGPPMQLNYQYNLGVNANFPDPVVVNGKSFEFIVICPQMVSWGNAGMVNDLINYAIKNYQVDTSKIYLTGLSMGGGISWEFAGTSTANSKRIAALLPVAGASYPTAYKVIPMAAEHLPVWATHNSIDPTVTPAYTTTYVALLKQYNADPTPLMTIFPDAGHGGWLKTYGSPTIAGVVQNGLNVYQWMLQYRRVGDNVQVEGSSSATPSVFTASAGTDVAITLPTNSTKLSGTATVQNETVSTTVWKQVSGPSTATISNGGTVTPTVSNLVAGTYVFEIDLTSVSGKTASDQVTVTVSPAPTLGTSAGADVSITLPTNSVKLTGTSTVTNTTVKTISWKQVSGPSTATITNGSTLTPTFSALVAGSYVFEIDLTSASGLSASDQVTVKVNAAAATLSANAGSDVTLSLPTNSVKLTGTATYTNSTVSKIAWKQVSGPSTAAIANGSTLTPTVSSLVAGSYVFELDLTGSTGLSSSDQVTVKVNSVSSSVSVSAGSDVNITLPTNSFILIGTATATNTTISKTAWKQVSGPSTAAIANGSTLRPTLSNLVEGSYVLELDVTASSGVTGSSQTTIKVNPKPTISANAGSDVSLTLPDNSTTLTGAATYANTSVAKIAWKQVSGPSTATIASASTLKPTVSGLIAGSYVFELDLTSGSGLTASDQVTVKVAGATLTASAGSDITLTLPTTSFMLIGSATTTNATISKIAWKQTSGPSTATIADAATLKPTIGKLVAGSYVFQLDVSNSAGNTASAKATVKVNPEPSLSAAAGSDVTITLPTSSVKLAGSAIYANTSVSKIAWKQVSGPSTATITTVSSLTPTVSGLVAGSYVFQLDLTSGAGLTASDKVTVKVNAKASSSTGSSVTVDQDGTVVESSFRLYPNPSHDIVNLSLTDTTTGRLEISLTSTDGRVMKKWLFDKQTQNWTQTIDPGSLSRGVYFIVIRGKNLQLTKSIIRN